MHRFAGSEELWHGPPLKPPSSSSHPSSQLPQPIRLSNAALLLPLMIRQSRKLTIIAISRPQIRLNANPKGSRIGFPAGAGKANLIGDPAGRLLDS